MLHTSKYIIELYEYIKNNANCTFVYSTIIRTCRCKLILQYKKKKNIKNTLILNKKNTKFNT